MGRGVYRGRTGCPRVGMHVDDEHDQPTAARTTSLTVTRSARLLDAGNLLGRQHHRADAGRPIVVSGWTRDRCPHLMSRNSSPTAVVGRR